MDAQTGQHLQRRSTKTADKRQAEAIAQDWLANGLLDENAGDKPLRKMSFCDYLTAFWDFDQSGYFRELETMGKEPCRRHARETRKLVGRYFEPYFRTLKLGQLNELKFQKLLVFLKTEKNLSASTANHARNAAIPQGNRIIN
jgi:hypothetical protein